MDEKKRKICIICSIVGFVLISVCTILAVAGSITYLLAIRLILYVIAAIVYAIKLGIEISSNGTWQFSACLLMVCLYNIASTAMELG